MSRWELQWAGLKVSKTETLRLFLEVGRRSSFTQAARNLGVSKAFESDQVGALEERLGVELLRRTTRKVGLTEEGRQYFVQGEKILALLEELEAEILLRQKEPRGSVRVTATVDLTAAVLAPGPAAFASQFPQIQVDLLLRQLIGA